MLNFSEKQTFSVGLVYLPVQRVHGASWDPPNRPTLEAMPSRSAPCATPLRLVRALYQLQSRRFLIRRPSHVVKPLDRVCMLHRFTNQSRVFSTPQDCQDQTCGAGSRRAPTVVHDHAAHFTRSKCNITPLLRNACSVPAAAAGSYKSMLMVIESKQESGVLLQTGLLAEISDEIADGATCIG